MRRISALLVMIFALAAPARGNEWGDLHLRFLYDGEPPAPRALLVDKDQAICGKQKLLDESLVVDKETRGIANVVVMLLKPKDRDVPIHESYEKASAEPAKIVSRNCRFEPHVLLMRTTQPLELDNEDPIGYNPKLELFANPSNSSIIPTGGPLRLHLRNEEPAPVRLDCTIHPWMSAFVIVRDNPYMSLSDKSGELRLRNVPAGEWTFRVWHERTGFINQVRHGEKTLEWPKGRMTLTIKSGDNELGEFRIPAEVFKRR